MWTLECDGDSLDHKKIWLRPGKKYLFGRTKSTPGQKPNFRIDHKSVSRQHLTLTVLPVEKGSGSLLNIRSKVDLKDEDTKFETEIDGVKIRNESRILLQDQHSFRLGKSDQMFHLKWQPTVFSFSLGPKKQKAGEDPLTPFRDRLEELDIKVMIPYDVRETTHVIAGKRNTAKGLQALINGKYIVLAKYVDAVVYAATPANLDEAESMSPLEEDFDANWPDPLEYLPPKSQEPSDRPAEEYAPDPRRHSIFEGYTVVFCEATQFDSLQAPVTNGGGKALLYDVEYGKTRAEDIVRFVKAAAGEAGDGELENGSDEKGVVVVRPRGPKDFPDLAVELSREVAQLLDFRLVDQGEFLDAILASNASVLRRRLPPGDDVSSRSTQARLTSSVQVKRSATQNMGPRGRPKIVSRFKGFDDEDEDGPAESAQIKLNSSPMNRATNTEGPHTQQNGVANGFHSSSRQHGSLDVTHEQSRKRSVPSSDPEDEEEFLDEILPATAALKRRKIEDEANGVSIDSFEDTKPKEEVQTKSKKEIDIKQVVRKQREAEEEAARQAEENYKESVEGMTVEEMKRLAVVEEMDMPSRRESRAHTNGTGSARWDDRWNGRKNFKKFRRKGDDSNAIRRGPAIVVSLEEAKQKKFGIGESYWGDEESADESRPGRRQGSQSQSQHTSRTATGSQHHTAEVPADLVLDHSNGAAEVIDLDAPRTTRGQDRGASQAARNSSGNTQASTANGKRSASSTMGPPMVKKRKKFAAAAHSDSE